MYMERILREAKKDTFRLPPERHLMAQCEVCGAIVRTSNRARHLKTTKHWQCKYGWTDRFEITRFRAGPREAQG